MQRNRFPHKGWSIDVLFEFGTKNLEVEIPVSIAAKLGPDFIVVNPPPSDDTKKSEINYKKTVKPSSKENENCVCFTLEPQRAGFWPFSPKAFFQFAIGAWKLKVKQKTIAHKSLSVDFWKMTVATFPSWTDIAISGLGAIYSLALILYPQVVPPLTAELNLSTLILPSSSIYLAYRIINWGRTIQSGS